MPKLEQLTLPSGEPFTYETLCVQPDHILEEVLRRGQAPSMQGIAGWEFKGYNTTPLARLGGVLKFKKGFVADGPLPEEGEPSRLVGYNVKIRQNGSLTAPWEDALKRGEPFRFGWFDVHPVRMGDLDNRYPDALLLNYGTSPRNPIWEPSRALRDYLVQVYPDNPDLLLGKGLGALGFMRLPLGFFVLGRHNRSAL